MTTAEPLNGPEERAWRGLMRLTVTVPRALGEYLEREAGVTGTDYAVLMHLSEAPGRRLRMSDLAEKMAFSAGRITRIVAEMVQSGLVTRVPSADDARSTLAELTDEGFATVERAYPYLLEPVRRTVFDHLDDDETKTLADLLSRLADAVDSQRPARLRR